MKLGTQIIYVPTHANGNRDHPDCEIGFVTSQKNDVVYCRYWSKYTKGDLRTKSGSEATPIEMVFLKNSVSQSQVAEAIRQYIPRG